MRPESTFRPFARVRSYKGFDATPQAQGLYDPRYEKDSCGVGMVADLTGVIFERRMGGALAALTLTSPFWVLKRSCGTGAFLFGFLIYEISLCHSDKMSWRTSR